MYLKYDKLSEKMKIQEPIKKFEFTATPEEMREYGLIGILIPLPEGETVESYLLKQPGVHKDEEGNIIYPNGRKQTPEDIKQIERFTHISIKDSLLKYQQKYQQQNK